MAKNADKNEIVAENNINNDIVAVENSAMMGLIAADAGSGLEEVDGDSFGIPYIVVLQALSPIVQDHVGDPNFMQGMFYNTVSKTTCKSFDFIPCHFQRRYIRWEKDAANGAAAFQGIYTPAEVELKATNGEMVKNEDGRYEITDDQGTGVLIDTRIHYVLYHNEELDSWEPAILSLSKTQVKHSKRLMTLIRTIQFKVNGKTINPPSWANIYTATTVKEKNDLGQWFSWNFTRKGIVKDADIYGIAKNFHDSVIKGDIKVSQPVEEENANKSQSNNSEDDDAF